MWLSHANRQEINLTYYIEHYKYPDDADHDTDKLKKAVDMMVPHHFGFGHEDSVKEKVAFDRRADEEETSNGQHHTAPEIHFI
ncbi:hypothetical protein U8335_05195 [Roseiconus lacunae]|uniref:hypothetical protein n=1 Tax=Roseiconus lacunae TaxID=2605694 RepID=UPI003091477A|nr:hypothetical protein U8335_05195 [Stieleria sp. HD01]